MKDLLADDHSELDVLLEQLFASFETNDEKLIFHNLDIFWARLAMHIRAEHLHLFPALINAAASETVIAPSKEAVKAAITELRDDHNFFMHELAQAVKQMRERLTAENRTNTLKPMLSDVHEKISAVSSRLQKHNELEESKVYQWSYRLLNSSELAALNERMQKELHNLPPRFDKNVE